jgi:hypothetical protein
MCIVMGADTALNAQPAASPGRKLQARLAVIVASSSKVVIQKTNCHFSLSQFILFKAGFVTEFVFCCD